MEHTSQADICYFDNLDKAFDNYSSYVKRLLIGDFNMETSEPRIDSFVYEHELHNFMKEKIYFKSVHNPSRIDLILRIVFGKKIFIFSRILCFSILE